jgi:uncharacterized membrane protein (DUF485 family)
MRKTTGSTFTADFRHEFEVETTTLLRRRFLLFTGLFLALIFLGVVMSVISLVAYQQGNLLSDNTEVNAWIYRGLILAVTSGMISLLVYLGCFIYVLRHRLPLQTLLNMAFWLVVFEGAVNIIEGRIVASPSVDWSSGVEIAVAHVLASLFLPWTPRQAIRPMVPLIALNAAALLLFGQASVPERLLIIALSPLAGVPGTIICWIRHSRRLERFKLGFLQKRYGEVRRELVDARRIHESLFPAPLNEGPVRFTYRYEPMRQIGGDYLHSHVGADGSLSLVIIDVTGHGIAAALTVNRLQGELQRIFAENPEVEPDDVLTLLNRYVHLTLSDHSIFATALCVRVDPHTSSLQYASGGHPPAFLRAVNGTIEQLGSTAFMLGACSAEVFQADSLSLRFGPGDTLVAYTDGAIEARNRTGRMFGINGLLRLIAVSRPDLDAGWPRTIADAVDRHRAGPPEDDTLVIEITRPIDVPAQAEHAGQHPVAADAQR